MPCLAGRLCHGERKLLEQLPVCCLSSRLPDTVARECAVDKGPLQKEDFAFWHQYLNGQKELPPPWKYCTQIVANNMNEALGQAYLASIPNAKEIRAKTRAMLKNIKNAFGLCSVALLMYCNAFL